MEKESLADRRTFRLTIAYEGTAYNGWQKQTKDSNAICVQEIVEQGIKRVFKKPFSFHASGRTDTGVHARAQVTHLRVETKMNEGEIARAINVQLPRDIRILSVAEADAKFNAQKDVEAKTYRYFILHTPNRDTAFTWPFLRNFTWTITFPLDDKKMEKALSSICGRHDFKSFQNTGTPLLDTVREIFSAELIVHKHENFPWMPRNSDGMRLLEIRVRGSGFLKQMVRTIVGTIVEVGRGKRALEDVEKVLLAKDRKKAGQTAPPQGLFLDSVEY